MQIKNFTLSIFCVLAFLSCKKDKVSNPTDNNNNNNNSNMITPHARTANSFGQPVADTSCIKKMYMSNPDTALNFIYDSHGLMTRMIQDNGFFLAAGNSIYFFYDSLSRLVRVENSGMEFLLDYGSSPDKAQTISIIFAAGNINTVLHLTYPDAYKIVSSQVDPVTNLETRDSLYFDANYNMLRSALVKGPVGGPFAPMQIETCVFNTAVRAPYASSTWQDNQMIDILWQGIDFDIWPIGRNFATDAYIYDYTQSGGPSLDHMSLMNQQVDANSFTTHTKHREDYVLSSSTQSWAWEFYYEYGCN